MPCPVTVSDYSTVQAALIDAAIERLVADAPEFSPEQRDRIAVLLRPCHIDAADNPMDAT